MEATPNSLPFMGIFLPRKMMRTNATAGTMGITHAFSRNHPDEA